MAHPIFHITSRDAWSRATETGNYTAPSLEAEGFIHGSDAHQVERSLNRFYRDADSVLILRIDPRVLKSELRYERADNDSFPHIYGPINTEAVAAVELIERGEGEWTYVPPE